MTEKTHSRARNESANLSCVAHPGLHDRLVADCHVLGRLDHSTVLLHRQASVGWLLLVPDTDAVDWQELDDAEHERIVQQVRAVSEFASDWFVADKMNIASIGNEVPQMHIHVVARRRDDVCWPRPVWGHLPADGPGYSADAIRQITRALVTQLQLKASETQHG